MLRSTRPWARSTGRATRGASRARSSAPGGSGCIRPRSRRSGRVRTPACVGARASWTTANRHECTLQRARSGAASWADVRLYLHQFRASVGVRRFAAGCDADLMRGDGTRKAVRVNFSDQGRPAALGFEFETDGLAIDLRLPSGDELAERTFEPALDRALSAAFLRRLVASDREIPRGV